MIVAMSNFFFPPIFPSLPFLGFAGGGAGSSDTGVGSGSGSGSDGEGSFFPPILPSKPFFGLLVGFAGSGSGEAVRFWVLALRGGDTSSSVASSSSVGGGGSGVGAFFLPPNLPSFLGGFGDGTLGGGEAGKLSGILDR